MTAATDYGRNEVDIIDKPENLTLTPTIALA